MVSEASLGFQAAAQGRFCALEFGLSGFRALVALVLGCLGVVVVALVALAFCGCGVFDRLVFRC